MTNPTAHLPDRELDQVAQTYALKGCAAAQRHLENLGFEISQSAIKAYFAAQIAERQTELSAKLPDLTSATDSASLLILASLAQAACCSRLQRIAIESGSYRVEAILSEALGRLHSQLLDVDF